MGIDGSDALADEFVGAVAGGGREGLERGIIGEFVAVGVDAGIGTDVIDAFVEAARLAE